MYRIQFKREPDYKQNEYCTLEFKGKFETDSFDPQHQQKSLIHLGQLKKITDGRYKLQIGVMDLIGKQVKLTTKQIVTETITNENNNTKTILIKGVVTKKIVFEGRPAPDMDRVVNTKRQSLGHKMFSKVQEKNHQQQLANEQREKEMDIEKQKGKEKQKVG